MFYLVLAQLPGYVSAAWLVERWGRKTVLAAYLTASGAATLLWAIADTTTLVLTAAALVNFFPWAPGPPCTPTPRSAIPPSCAPSGIGVASGYARIGGVAAPLAGSALLGVSVLAALGVFAAAFMLAAAVVAGYARDTRGIRLGDTLAEVQPSTGQPT